MEDKSKKLNKLWKQYDVAFKRAEAIVQKIRTEPDQISRAKLRHTLKRLDSQRIKLLDQMDEI
jgi:hypothetical protein